MSGRQPLGELSAPHGIGYRASVSGPPEIAEIIRETCNAALEEFRDCYVRNLEEYRRAIMVLNKWKAQEYWHIYGLRSKLEDENINPIVFNYENANIRQALRFVRGIADRAIAEYEEERNDLLRLTKWWWETYVKQMQDWRRQQAFYRP